MCERAVTGSQGCVAGCALWASLLGQANTAACLTLQAGWLAGGQSGQKQLPHLLPE